MTFTFAILDIVARQWFDAADQLVPEPQFHSDYQSFRSQYERLKQRLPKGQISSFEPGDDIEQVIYDARVTYMINYEPHLEYRFNRRNYERLFKLARLCPWAHGAVRYMGLMRHQKDMVAPYVRHRPYVDQRRDAIAIRRDGFNVTPNPLWYLALSEQNTTLMKIAGAKVIDLDEIRNHSWTDRFAI